ncbi:hypothetical protein ISCGN_031951 [Ixodes scapularis]
MKRGHLKEVLRDMKLALQSGVSVNGVKGPSPFATLPNSDLVWGFNVDCMHCVLLGVARQFTEYLLNSTNCHKHFYIGSPSVVAEVNQRLLSIRPPHCVTRLPRPVGDRNFWKVREWRQWLLFYYPPCTLGILRQLYWNHLCCLVGAIHILLSEELSQGQLKHAESFAKSKHGVPEETITFQVSPPSGHEDVFEYLAHARGHLLQRFVAQVERLYKMESCMTCNVFENGNGNIVKSVTAAKGVPMQIVERVVAAQELQQLLTCVPLGHAPKELCHEKLSFKRVAQCLYTDGACILGSPTAVGTLTCDEGAALEVAGVVLPVVALEHTQFILERKVYNSSLYSRAKKSDSSVIKTRTEEYIKIMRILEVHSDTATKCLLLCKKIVEIESDVRGSTTAKLPELQQQFYAVGGFPGVVGVIDGTHVRIQGPPCTRNCS